MTYTRAMQKSFQCDWHRTVPSCGQGEARKTDEYPEIQRLEQKSPRT